MNATIHKEAQNEWKAKNAETWYKNGRVEVKDDLDTFKKNMGLYPDVFLANWA